MTEELSPAARRYALAVSLGFALFVLAGRVLPEEQAFPLSRYPMFSQRRPAQEELPYVEIGFADGSSRRVDAAVWNGANVSSGRSQLRALPRLSPAGRRSFCQHVAAAIAAAAPAPEIRTIRAVSGMFSRERLVRDGDDTPLQTRTIVECAGGGS
jgi:hypothetical protein